MKVNPLPRTKYFVLDLYQYNCTHLFRLEPSYLGVMAAANDIALTVGAASYMSATLRNVVNHWYTQSFYDTWRNILIELIETRLDPTNRAVLTHARYVAHTLLLGCDLDISHQRLLHRGFR